MPRGRAIGSIIPRSAARSRSASGPGSKPNTASTITSSVSVCMLAITGNGSPTGHPSIARSVARRIVSA